MNYKESLRQGNLPENADPLGPLALALAPVAMNQSQSKFQDSDFKAYRAESGEVMSLHAQGTSPNLMLPPFWLKFQQTEELTNYYQQPLASLRLGRSGLAVVCSSTYYARALAINTLTSVKSLTWVSTFINAANKSFNEGTIQFHNNGLGTIISTAAVQTTT